MKDYRFAKFININGKFEPFEDERDINDLQSKEIERLQTIINKTNSYLKSHSLNEYIHISKIEYAIELLEGNDNNETNNNN